MTRVLFLISLLAPFLFFSCGDYDDDLEYFPFEPGRTWQFSAGMKGAIQAGKESEEQVLSVESSADFPLKFEILLDDDHLVTKNLELARGLKIQWVRFPLDEEEEWKFRFFTGEYIKARYEGRGATTVPAGAFNDCVKIRYTFVRPDGQPLPGGGGGGHLLWFARGVGLVRIDYFGPTDRQPYVLRSYTKP